MGQATPTPGQLAYEADCRSVPTYDDGTPRRPWAALDKVAQGSWERDPTPRDWAGRLEGKRLLATLRERETSAPKPCADFLRYLDDTAAAMPSLTGPGLAEALSGLRHFVSLDA